MLENLDTQLTEDPTFLASVEDRGWTMLHYGALAGDLGVMVTLLEHGADPNAKTSDGKDAATLACSLKREAVADQVESHSSWLRECQ